MAPALNRAKAVTGFTLLELLTTLAVIGVVLCLGDWGAGYWLRNWQVDRAAQQVYEDIKRAQAVAEQSGNLTLVNGSLLDQRSFLVFEPDQSAYSLYHWRDGDQDGEPELTESQQVWSRQLPKGVRFELAPGIDRKACSNQSGTSSSTVSFASPAYPHCHDQPCIKFDHQGFSVIGPGAVYLSDGRRSMALTLTRPGHVTLCRWNGTEWQ
ncbi:MAG: hypothetical protein C0614_09840 [Desulfuromonas sp.]|nr:MAG: hypothetical protein C0614_09840 [Desulfuromonas sp.]